MCKKGYQLTLRHYMINSLQYVVKYLYLTVCSQLLCRLHLQKQREKKHKGSEVRSKLTQLIIYFIINQTAI